MRRLTFLILVAWALGGGTAAAAPKTSDLLAHGSGESLWTARVITSISTESQPSVETIIHARFSGAAELRPMARLNAQAIDLTSRGSQLVVLLRDGRWRLVWPGGSATGAPLPGSSTKMLALAGEANRLWAVGRVRGGIKALATRPATEPSSRPTTAATTSVIVENSDPRLVLFRLESGDWEPYAELPDSFAAAADREISLGVNNVEQPSIAWADGNAVHAIRLTRQRQWKDLGSISTDEPVVDFDWVNDMPRPTIWIAAESGPGSVFVKEDRAWRRIDLETADAISVGEHRAVAVALERIRLIYTHHGKVMEQRYELSGARLNDAVQLSLDVPVAPGGKYLHWLNLSAMVALILAMVGSTRRRRGMSLEQILRNNPPLAPLGARLAAGIIDALPAIAGLLLVRRDDWSEIAAANALTVADLLSLWIGMGLYLLHTTLGEMLWGRSLGKKLFGLRVVSMDARPAGPVAVLLRNVLRLAEMPIAPVVFIMMLYSPLRQRAGDIAAATIVVVHEPPKDEKEKSGSA